MFNTRTFLGGAVCLTVLALVAWVFLLPEAPKPPPAPGDEPWPGARALAGTWRLHQDEAVSDGNCRGRDVRDYALSLAIPAPPLHDGLRGRFTVRQARTDAGACPQTSRDEDYAVTVMRNAAGELEMTMAAQQCSENGKPCAEPLPDRKGRISYRNGELVFGSQSLKKDS
jgi:hypothetical protein